MYFTEEMRSKGNFYIQTVDRKELAEFALMYKTIAGAILLIATVAYFALGGNTLTMLFFCVAALVYTLGCKRGVLVNPVAKFLGGISFEIYLCHMVIYRVLEKLHLVHLFENGLLAYIFTAVAVLCGSVVFSVCAKWFLNKIETFLKERVAYYTVLRRILFLDLLLCTSVILHTIQMLKKVDS